ncbi:unnamed protein product [Heligmosomoides polygyrus]|uniref:Uncharacterized protein n=1 Tax=Heligmosomoides polygyrus TaxID=6339 RepID=A0A183FXV2_HELPZ|nr:unnamed protein product [Heligmosomoides polygyrus]
MQLRHPSERPRSESGASEDVRVRRSPGILKPPPAAVSACEAVQSPSWSSSSTSSFSSWRMHVADIDLAMLFLSVAAAAAC